MSALAPGTRVLVVEDEAIIAMCAEDMIEAMGGVLAGSVCTLADALRLIETVAFDVALLDINLNGETSLPLADRLVDLGRPFAFATGYGETVVPARHLGAPLVNKPYGANDLEAALAHAIAG